MKKITLALLLFSLIGCSNLQSTSTRNTAIQAKVSESIDPTTEVYGLGDANITYSGSFIIEEEARVEALKNLEKQVAIKVGSFADQYMNVIDDYTRKVYSPALADLKSYSTTKSMENAVERTTFTHDGKAYVIVTVSNSTIHSQVKEAFLQYTTDLLTRLETTKDSIATSQYFEHGTNAVSVDATVEEDGTVNYVPVI